MASGTVGYTDTRGNKDYTSIIANQIGKRLKEASNMASEERAYAAGMAEAGGTSLQEAGIGKGYFFGRALGNRFGGDRISRTRGRMGASGPGTNPAASYKQRFRGGFDYNVTNEVSNITDTAPLSNAIVTGLRGVQGGLVQVASAISRQDSTMDGLANTQADMAKAIMFNGYLFQMFMSQQKAKSGRSSAMREERSIEGRGFGGGRRGIRLSGGGGAGRGMINVTPRGGGAGGGAGGRKSGGPGVGAAGFLSLGSFASAGGELVSQSMSAGKNMISGGLKGASTYKALSTGDIVGMVGSNSLYKKYNIDIASVAAKNPSNIAQAAAKMFGLGGDQTSAVMDIVKGGTKNPKYADAAATAAKKFGDLYTTSDSYVKGMLEADVIARQFGKNPDAIAESMQNALGNLRENNTLRNKFNRNPGVGSIGYERAFADMTDYEATYKMVIDKYGEKNADQFMKLGLFGTTDSLNLDELGRNVLRNDAIADSLAKHYDNMTYESLEKAVLLARVGDMTDSGMSSTKIVKELREKMGNNVADDLIMKYGDDVLSNTAVGKLFGKGSAKVGIRRFLKAIPGIGLGLGIVFGIQRALQGDLLGAGLEITSGVLGLNPATTGLGMGIDGFLLARDLGAISMRTGGRMSGFGTNSLLSVNGMPVASFNEPGNPESIVVERDNEDRFVDMGKGIVDGFKQRRGDYVALQASGVERGINTLGQSGFFSGLVDNTKDVVNNVKKPFGGIMNWFNRGAKPNEGAMSWKDLLSDDWNQRQFTKGPGKGGWNPLRGMPGYGSIKNFLTGTPGNEIAGGFQTGPTPLIRQSILRGAGLLMNPKAAILAALMKPTALGDGTLTGNTEYLNSLGNNQSMQLQNLPSSGSGLAATVINNNYYQNSSSGGTESGDETLGQSFNMDLEKFITNYSIMSK